MPIDVLTPILKEFGLLVITLVIFFVTLKNKVTEIGKKLVESDEKVEQGFEEVNRGVHELSRKVNSMSRELSAHDVRTQDLRERVIRLEDHWLGD